MVCANCGGCGHNKRTCTSPKVTSNQPTRSEKRVAKSLAALLPPPNNKKVSKPLEGLGGCQNIWKEPKSFYEAKKVSKPLEDISPSGIWKEPKDYYTKPSAAKTPRPAAGRVCSSHVHASPPDDLTSTSGKKHKSAESVASLNNSYLPTKTPRKEAQKVRDLRRSVTTHEPVT